jgi:hypothetical protein
MAPDGGLDITCKDLHSGEEGREGVDRRWEAGLKESELYGAVLDL